MFMYYTTEVDGFKKIFSHDNINSEQFLTIYDEDYVDEVSLYKVKKVKENKLDLTLVKVLSLVTVPQESEYKATSLYQFENTLLFTEGRVNKNQTIAFNNQFYIVKDIIKQDGPKLLVLEKIIHLHTTNIYTIYRNIDGKESVYELIDNYGAALKRVFELKGKRDGSFYRFI